MTATIYLTLTADSSNHGTPIKFRVDGPTMTAVHAGATVTCVRASEHESHVGIVAADGRVIADLAVRTRDADDDVTSATVDVVAALLWSHERWIAAKSGHNVPPAIAAALRELARVAFRGAIDESGFEGLIAWIEALPGAAC